MLSELMSAKSMKSLALAALISSAVTAEAASPYHHLRAPRYDMGNTTDAVPSGSMRATGTAVSIKSTGVSAPKPINTTEPAKKPNATSVYDHRGIDTSLNPWFNATGDWLNKSCLVDDFSGKSIDPDGVKLWKEADADTALTQLLDAWNNKGDQFQDWTFSRFVWSVFNVTGGNNEGPHVDCSDPYDEICSQPIKCDPSIGIAPAGYLIINSLVSIHKIYQMQHNALNDAYNAVNGNMQVLVDNFDWTPAPNKDLEILEEIFGVLKVALGAVSGGTIAEAFTAIKVFGTITEEAGKTIKTVASTGLGLTNDILGKIPAPSAQGDIAGDLSAVLESGYTGLSDGSSAMLETLVEGKGDQNQSLLHDFMNTGLLLDYFNENTNNTDDVTKKAISMMYGQLIPAAWGLSTEGLKPFILRIDAKDMKCNGSFPKDDGNVDISTYFDKNVAQDALWCDDLGNSFWLLNGVHQDPCESRFGCVGQNKPPFGLLPGGNSSNLNGDPSNWGGLHLGDIIRSSWGGFQANNKQNGYTIPKGTSEQVAANLTFEGSDGLPLAGGVLTPGFFNFTICLDYNEALKNLRSTDKNAPICGQSPSPGDSSTGLNAPGSYTPGWCKLHVDQYQRNEGNENPLNDYQLSINMFDGASLLVGDATKQSAAEPLAIVDSVLPSQLIVATGAGDDDPLSFWYADQFWLSNSTQNQCSQGKYDSGMRQIDCGFNCPLPPSGSPPVSATKDHPLPEAPTDAVAGTAVFHNTYITATPTPTPSKGAPPPPKPTPTYATGQCGLHVRQYQKNEKDENPTNNYEVEATIFDAKHNAIGTSGQVQAPPNVPITVNGLISPFNITAFNVDDDGLKFFFSGSTFWSNSSSCSVGKYDSGHRDMDCGFGC